MSLILEALKKSESQRRLGEAPDLGTPFAAPRRRGSLLPWLIVAILAAGAVGWWLLRSPPAKPVAATTTPAKVAAQTPNPAAPTASPARQVASAPAPSAPPAPATPPGTVAAAAPAKTSAQPVVTGDPNHSPWVAVGRSADNGMRAATKDKPLPANMHRVTPEAKPVADAAKTPASVGTAPVPTRAPKTTSGLGAAADAAKPSVATNATKAAPLAKAPKTPDMLGLTPAADASKPPMPTDATGATPLAKAAKTPEMKGLTPPTQAVVAKAEAPAPAGDAPKQKPELLYYELPFNVRKALPTLRLSMHVYAGDAKQRFVILNDSRLAEGEKTSDEVTLREVRPDGAILEFQGQRFFYPRDGL